MSNATPHQTKTTKILIIEDEGDMCLLLNIMLDSKGMELDHVKTLASAEEYLQKEQPAVVILDNRLPDGFGIDFIPQLKKKYPAIKVIAISGVDGAAKDVALENGAEVFLEKPFTRGQVFEAISRLIDQQEPVA